MGPHPGAQPEGRHFGGGRAVSMVSRGGQKCSKWKVKMFHQHLKASSSLKPEEDFLDLHLQVTGVQHRKLSKASPPT